jgi:hypothetical protein
MFYQIDSGSELRLTNIAEKETKDLQLQRLLTESRLLVREALDLGFDRPKLLM